MEELFAYLPGPELRKIAVEWDKYGADPSVCEQVALERFFVQDFRERLAKANEERADLYWQSCKLTREGVGDWAEDFGERIVTLQFLTDAHFAKALADFDCQRRAPSTCHGRVFLCIFLAYIMGAEPLISPIENHQLGLRLLKIENSSMAMQVRCRCRCTCITIELFSIFRSQRPN